MRIAVVGAGIVGVTTAYELASAGHEVQVFERRGAVAAETSFANAGVIAPGYVTPWAAPGMPWKVLAQLFKRHAAVRFAGVSALREWPWMLRWLRACRGRTYRANRAVLQQLAHFSRDRLLELTKAHHLEYEQRQGYLVLLRTPRDVQRAAAGLALLRELGVKHELVEAEAVRRLEPKLSADTPLAGGIHLPADGVGNCRQFAQALKAEAQKLGARFAFDADVQALQPGATPALLRAGVGPQAFEQIVLCAGVDSTRLLAPLGLKLPLAPVFGYSLTAPLRSFEGQPLGPHAALMDETYKVAISRLGQRVRVAGSAELGGELQTLRAGPLATLYRVLDDWFPGAANLRDVQQWKGARPMLPDGPPLVCKSPWRGIWLNLGHGSSGWALACGSARVIAERVSGREAPVPAAGLGLERLGIKEAVA